MAGAQVRLNAIWGIVGNLSSSAANFLVFIVIARFLGATEFGSFAYVFAIATLFSMMGQAGLDGLLSRELIEKKGEQLEILGTAGLLRFTGYIFGMLLTIIYAYAIPSHTDLEIEMFLVASVFVFLNFFVAIPENWLKSMGQAQMAAKGKIWSNFIGSLLKVIFVVMGAGALILSVIHLVSLIITAILMYTFYLNLGGPKISKWKFNYPRMNLLLSESWRLFLSAILWVVYMRVDLVILRYMSGPEVVANYSIATRIAEVTYAVPSAVVIAFFPKLIAIREVSKKDYHGLIQEILYILSFLGFSISILSIVFSYFGIVKIFGSQYSYSVDMTMIYMLSTPLFFIHYLVSRWILLEKLTKFGLCVDVFVVFFKSATTVVLIKIVGFQGVAFSAILSYMVLSWLCLLFIKDSRILFEMVSQSLLKPWKGFNILFNRIFYK